VMSSKPFNIYLMYQWLKWDISHGGKIKWHSHLKLHHNIFLFSKNLKITNYYNIKYFKLKFITKYHQHLCIWKNILANINQLLNEFQWIRRRIRAWFYSFFFSVF
jgi:hypothetical protein